jgi:hypothetical protein
MRLLSVACIICVASALLAQGPTVKPSTPTAVELVDQLGSPSYQMRENAAKELVERGASAQAALKAALDHPELEVRTRAAELLAKVNRAVDSQTQTTAKRIKLEYQSQPLVKVLADFKTKSGIPISMEWPRGSDQIRLVDRRGQPLGSPGSPS